MKQVVAEVLAEEQLSLVEQDIERIDALIAEDYADPCQGPTRTIREARELLETRGISLDFAIIDSGMLEDVRYNYYTDREFIAGGPAFKREVNGLRFDREQLLRLNRHPYVRTLSLNELIPVLELSGPVIREISAELGVEPAMPAGIQPTTAGRNIERFNKDQVLQINDYARDRFRPPKGAISEPSIIQATKISGFALKDIKAELGLEPNWYKHPESGEGQLYLTRYEALRVLQYIRQRKLGGQIEQ